MVKKVQNHCRTIPRVSCSSPELTNLPLFSLFHALQNVGKTNLCPKVAYFSSKSTCSLLEQLKINAKKYALRTLNGSFLDAKTFDLKIDQIDHGRRFRSNGNGAWWICFKAPHADGLSGSLVTLNVKGSIGGGAISRRSSRLTRQLLATPSIVRGDGLRDRRGRS